MFCTGMIYLTLFTGYHCYNEVSRNSGSLQKRHEDRCARSRERDIFFVNGDICDFCGDYVRV